MINDRHYCTISMTDVLHFWEWSGQNQKHTFKEGLFSTVLKCGTAEYSIVVWYCTVQYCNVGLLSIVLQCGIAQYSINIL